MANDKDDETRVETHPSYGMAGFSRISNSGHTPLFGSHLDTHYNSMRLRIKRGERRHDLSMDWYSAREELIEVEFSAAQFADLLTQANIGDGVPCTIRWIGGKSVESPPRDAKTEIQRVTSGFKEKIKALRDGLKAKERAAKEILEKKSLTKDDRATLLSTIGEVGRFLWDNAPFVMDQFVESAGKVVTAAKQEVEAGFTSMVQRAGLTALADSMQMPQIPQLEAGPVVDAEFTDVDSDGK